jgi:hypothetical protein
MKTLKVCVDIETDDDTPREGLLIQTLGDAILAWANENGLTCSFIFD